MKFSEHYKYKLKLQKMTDAKLEIERLKYHSEKLMKTLSYITRCEEFTPEEMDEREKLFLIMRIIAEKQNPTLITNI